MGSITNPTMNRQLFTIKTIRKRSEVLFQWYLIDFCWFPSTRQHPTNGTQRVTHRDHYSFQTNTIPILTIKNISTFFSRCINEFPDTI